MSRIYYFDEDKAMAVCERYLQTGHDMLKADRQADVDGFLRVLRSEQAIEKLAPAGLQPKETAPPAPVRTVLEAERARG